MFLSGIGDEAGPHIVAQINAHAVLGWDDIELRMVDGQNICEMPNKQFNQICKSIHAYGLKVSCFGSKIGDWSRPITVNPLSDCNVLRRAIKRMHRLNVPYIRIMSYPNHSKTPIPETEWRRRSINRMKGLVKIAEGEGITLAHENCSGWGGITPGNNLALLREIDSKAFGVLFDTGNPPSYGEDSWEWYQAVKDRIVYVHIKDAKQAAQPGEKEQYTMPGEGDGYVREIIEDLLRNGYDGGFSIEPHLNAVIHTGQTAPDSKTQFQTYIDYGSCLAKIVLKAQVEPAL